jgi:hypothetical protein
VGRVNTYPLPRKVTGVIFQWTPRTENLFGPLAAKETQAQKDESLLESSAAPYNESGYVKTELPATTKTLPDVAGRPETFKAPQRC